VPVSPIVGPGLTGLPSRSPVMLIAPPAPGRSGPSQSATHQKNSALMRPHPLSIAFALPLRRLRSDAGKAR